MATPKNLLDYSSINEAFQKQIKEFGITEIFFVNGEVHITSEYDLPPSTAEYIENYVLSDDKYIK